MRRFALAWHNALDIARAGRLTAPYGAPFEVVHADRVYRLRHYAPAGDGEHSALAPLLLVPPLMVTAEVYDISPEVSAIAYLTAAGVDVWLVDYGRPEREEGGMSRTLDDHVRAVSEAVDRVRAHTGRDVHLAGYSQGGMFCYQAAALRRSDGVASVVAFGAPVDMHRALRLGEDVTERLITGARALLAWPLARLPGLPGIFTAAGFKLLSARKEALQLIDFIKNLHDREALEKREAKRLFLGGEGFVAWPGPAFRQFVDDLVVGNRMALGGFVIDGRTASLADITCPILYFIGDRDEMARPASVRAIRRASPKVAALHEVQVATGHFGLIVGTAALTTTWPSVVAWLAWRNGDGLPPGRAIESPGSAGARSGAERRGESIESPGSAGARSGAERRGGAIDLRARPPADGDGEAETDDDSTGHAGFDFALARELIEKTAKAVVDRFTELSEDLGSYLDSARWQLPRLNRLRHLHDNARISLGQTLADQAREIPDRTFFLFRGRAFSYADANRRVEAVVRGLIACGVCPGDHVGVMMASRPSQLSVVTALSRLGAVAVLLSPATADHVLPRALALGATATLVVDPEAAARARAAVSGAVLVLGGAGSAAAAAGTPRALPAGVTDMEAIEPDGIDLPAWYRPDAGRACELAMIFVSSGRHEPPRAVRITNRRWAFSALGAAAAATLTTRDTVYCCLPLHHPSGTLVATGSAMISGARLALASQIAASSPGEPQGGLDAFSPDSFWDEVRRYGVSVVYYAGEMCRRLVDAPTALGESNHPVRLFAGSGMRRDVWRRLTDRFGPLGVLEMYASSEAAIVLANARGKKLGSVGRPLPGSPDVAIAAYAFARGDLARGDDGRLIHARLDEPGMLLARQPRSADPLADQPAAAAADPHHRPRQILHDAFATGDRWLVTGDFFSVDAEGDYRFVGRRDQIIATRSGPVTASQIEDALYELPGIALCIATGRPDPDDAAHAAPVAALQLLPDRLIESPGIAGARSSAQRCGGSIDLAALSAIVASLPEHARPRRIRLVAVLPLTDGFRPIHRATDALDFADGPDVLIWHSAMQHYEPSTPGQLDAVS